MAHFCLENGSFAIMSLQQQQRKETVVVVGCKSQQFSYQTKFAHIMSNCHTVWLDSHGLSAVAARLKFLSAPVSMYSIILCLFFSTTMLISFHINDFCYFVSRWQYAWNRKNKTNTRVDFFFFRSNNTPTETLNAVRCNAWKKSRKVFEMHLCTFEYTYFMNLCLNMH